jgi:hypothetical protein
MPASTRARPLVLSISSTRRMRSSRSNVPSVSAASVNEWPAPATRTVRLARRARSIASATSAALAGCSIAAGRQA